MVLLSFLSCPPCRSVRDKNPVYMIDNVMKGRYDIRAAYMIWKCQRYTVAHGHVLKAAGLVSRTLGKSPRESKFRTKSTILRKNGAFLLLLHGLCVLRNILYCFGEIVCLFVLQLLPFFRRTRVPGKVTVPCLLICAVC